MWEINIRNKETGELDVIFGHNAKDAFNRMNLNADEWFILNEIYID